MEHKDFKLTDDPAKEPTHWMNSRRAGYVILAALLLVSWADGHLARFAQLFVR